MFALYYTTFFGERHTLFFKTREERADFMSDPCVFISAKAYRLPVESEMCDPSGEEVSPPDKVSSSGA